MNMPSFYQADFFRTLSAHAEIDLQVIYAKRLPDQRLQLGWKDDLNGYKFAFLNAHRAERSAARLAWSQRDRIHIINGMFAERSLFAALVTLALGTGRYLIHSEAPNPSTARSLAKRMLRSAMGNVLARRAAGILAISGFAREFYQALGVREERLYPFGYFRLKAQLGNLSTHWKSNGRIEIIFVGQLIRRKGVDILIDALGPFFEQHQNLFLTIVGAGEMQAILRSQVTDLGLGDRVVFEGVIPSDKVQARLAGADLLVLPSRWDGWGLVVNEAFSAGVPVVVSDRCGVADLVHHGVNGYVFSNEDMHGLRACIGQFLDRRTDRSYLGANASEMGDRISTEVAVPYLIACLRHVMGLVKEKPTPPWVYS